MDTSRYADLFLTESREHLSAINHALLALERAPDDAEALGAIFRAVHTVKGMSATMGYTPIADLSHELETLLDKVRRGERHVTPELMDVLFAAADALEASIERVVAGQSEAPEIAGVVDRLRALAEGRPGGAGPGTAAPAATRRKRGRKSSPDAAAAETAQTAARWSAPAAEGPGLLVRVRLHAGTPLKGVRAFLIVQKARGMGVVGAVAPPIEALQDDAFDHDFSFRLEPRVDVGDIEEVLQGAGDVEEVLIEAAAGTPGPPRPTARHRLTPLGVPQVSEQAIIDRAAQQARHIRIDLRRLDSLMNLIGELVIARGRLQQLVPPGADASLEETVGLASRLISDLQDQIMTSRMVPVWQVFDRFPRLVRDAARMLDKRVDFVVEGKEIELDRSMLDEIGDPIVHLLRNAIDHGIESPETRVALGKPPVGRLVLAASRDRSSVLIRVTDDGRGIDRARVLARAKETGLVDAARTELSDEELLRIISRPGFSTAERITEVSGRGVGIDVVQNRVRSLGGSVEIRSVPGQGTSVTFRLPLTLAILRALLARVGGELFALPMTHIDETVELDRDAVRTVRGTEVLVLREDVLPLVRMRARVGLPETDGKRQQVVILELADRRAALVVDELAGQQEIVVKQFDAVKEGLALFSGATILGDGNPALIVDVNTLV